MMKEGDEDWILNSDFPKPKKEFDKGIRIMDKSLGDKFGYSRKKSEYIARQVKRFWKFIKEDSWASLIVSLVLAFLIIKFIFFPFLSFVTGTSLPLVIVESCSMYHSDGMDLVFKSPIYGQYGLSLEDSKNWSFKNGLSKGDIIFAVGADYEDLHVGDVIIFNGRQRHPIIHRIISINDDGTVTTKGDNFKTNSGLLDIERSIKSEQIIGKAVFRVPYLGWLKLIFFEAMRPASERGFCS